ncbi:hypothetical protein LTR62_000383 [Meristemomyces frigidus]|uniref:PAC domain-containing protein n=1 Tax=Meristemomyces frigidus TaxID=1508187 RepID=A0AAN7TME2_9PEZI|nr:hypothetical protein LTR62_000383 [Meristemomyces frigidus]
MSPTLSSRMIPSQARAARRKTPLLPFLHRKQKPAPDSQKYIVPPPPQNASQPRPESRREPQEQPIQQTQTQFVARRIPLEGEGQTDRARQIEVEEQSRPMHQAQDEQQLSGSASLDEPETEQTPVETSDMDFGMPSSDPEQALPFGHSVPQSSRQNSVFDKHSQQFTPQTTVTNMNTASGDDEPSYDLKPPAPAVSHDNVEALAVRLFSTDHLDAMLRDHHLAARFARFLTLYRPQQVEVLAKYLETRKAVAAIEYANALAESLQPDGSRPYVPAVLDPRFAARSEETAADLIEEALPAFITHRLTLTVTDTLVKEITGNSAPVMRELIPSLAEVYCVTDPSLPDNPIVYASEEFYNTTQYGREYVIGRNCRFLQGPKSSNASVTRMIEALQNGQEICETILNYRRDGSPFINLLLIAPLYDNKGQVRYFLGCQIDVSSLVENGRGIESFSTLLKQDRRERRFGGPDKTPKHVLSELGQMLTDEESRTMSTRAQSMSSDRPSMPAQVATPEQRGRRILLGMEDTPTERSLWPHPSLGPSGRLPGVYQNYLLVRPYPSLRITFTSPALRIPGLLQTKLLDRIGGPTHIREGILDALAHGTSVTAKVAWLTHPLSAAETAEAVGGKQEVSGLVGKARWIHCTPLMGSDERVGVWMIVMVENETVTGMLNRQRDGGMGSNSLLSTTGASGAGGVESGVGSQRYTSNGNKLYSEYLRREGRTEAGSMSQDGSTSTVGGGPAFGARVRSGASGAAAAHQTTATAIAQRERREVDDQFRDF